MICVKGFAMKSAQSFSSLGGRLSCPGDFVVILAEQGAFELLPLKLIQTLQLAFLGLTHRNFAK